jgi:uncharacterized protein YndB with AHSA1/START domain
MGCLYQKRIAGSVVCAKANDHQNPNLWIFSEGGQWIYVMIEPNGTEYWGRMDYVTIQPIDSYTGLDGFCDNNGVLNPDLPRADWDVKFTDMGDNALVTNVVTYNSLTDLETVINMGMEEGMKSTLERLDDLLLKLKQ